MSNVYFSLLTPLLFLLLGAGQWCMWRMWRKYTEQRWMGLALLALGAGIVVQMLTRAWPLPVHVLSFTFFYLLSTSCAGLALARRLKVGMPWRLAALLVLLALALQTWFSVVQPNLAVRVVGLSVLALLLMGLPLLHWRQMRLSNRFDGLLRWLYVLCITANIARTLLQAPLGLHVVVDGQFMDSRFWLVLHVFAMFTGMALAGCMFLAVLRDVLDQLQHDRNTDVLTCMLNRRGLQVRLNELTGIYGDAPPECALLLLDIDHFKQINDRLGHAVGDQVLQQVAARLKHLVRGNDVVCRYGGEEFMLILVGANAQVAQQVAERIRLQIQQARLPALAGDTLTVSIGWTALQGMQPEDVMQAFEVADARLYAAKRAGRNQVVGMLEPVRAQLVQAEAEEMAEPV